MRRARTRLRLRRYVLGIDFGTLSGRALLVDVDTGDEVATAVHNFASGVIEKRLPGRKERLPHATALQDPQDYLTALATTVPEVMREANVSPEQVLGIGLDFTSCTMLPTTSQGVPLCALPRWRHNPHAWVKLWKHHAAQPQADQINRLGRRRQEHFLAVYGGKYSSEWFFSKLLETVQHAPEVFAAADRFIEAGDWLVWQLCGEERRGQSAAGFKAMWVYPAPRARTAARWSYPPKSFFKALHPALADVVSTKLRTDLAPLGGKAGGLTPALARKIGLWPGTPVAVANIDAHAAVPACGVTTPGKMVMIIGTSTCHLLVDRQRRHVEGQCGVVENGVIPGYWGYEAGQAGVGDSFAWFAQNSVPTSFELEARATGKSVHEALQSEAARLQPGESGLLALDWWNGCRSVLMDSDLTGLIVGVTLATQPPEIYRALIEATAFGTRKIIESFERSGIAVRELHACGGPASRNPLLLQIYADVTGKSIRVAASDQASALGAGMFAAVAAEVYPDIHTAARRMTKPSRRIYRPSRQTKSVYDQLYAEYTRLHDRFGRAADSPMKKLLRIRRRALAKRKP